MMDPIIKAYMTDLNAQMEEDILKVCHSYGIDLNKERLMQALTAARKFYDEGYRAGKMDAGPKWISVEDELPKPSTDVLVYRRSVCGMGGYMAIEHMTLGYGDDILWINDISSWKSKVTHWMPLPEPPGKEE